MKSELDVLVVTEKASVARAFALHLAKERSVSDQVEGVPVHIFARNGEKWAALGVRGHVMDYDFPDEYNRWSSVEPRQLFSITPIQEVRGVNLRYAYALKKLAHGADLVLLALDSDVEGESIAFEVMKIIKESKPDAKFKRASFSALTKKDLLTAVENLKEPNKYLAEKAFARMILDLTLGAAFTRTLTLLVERRMPKIFPKGKFLSYGPCQTPVLYLVVQRAQERQRFKTKKYYDLEITALISGEEVKLTYDGERIEDREKAERLLLKTASEKSVLIVETEYRGESVPPPVPLNTIELERRASRYLDIRPKKALAIAEELYRDGFISYPRTETTKYPSTINLGEILNLLKKNSLYGRHVTETILKRKTLSPTEGADDDKAHPPIHPLRSVDERRLTRRFEGSRWRVYDLVARHFLSTLSVPAIVEKQRIVVSAGGIYFMARGRRILKQGYYEIYPFERPGGRKLPAAFQGSRANITDAKIVEKETKPPPFLSESELLRLMRQYGIGTDATMQEHIATNVDRGYFFVEDKRCIPSRLGITLATSLHEVVPEIVVPEVRGRMEKKLKTIAMGERPKEEIIQTVKADFLSYYDKLKSQEETVATQLLKPLKMIYGVDLPRFMRASQLERF